MAMLVITRGIWCSHEKQIENQPKKTHMKPPEKLSCGEQSTIHMFIKVDIDGPTKIEWYTNNLVVSTLLNNIGPIRDHHPGKD